MMKKEYFLALLLVCGCNYMCAQRSKKGSPLSPKLEQLYSRMDAVDTLAGKQKPLIGISTSIDPKRIRVNTAYVRSVELAGGIPYILPVTSDAGTLRQIVDRLDGIVFTGGEDISPAYYGAQPVPELGELSPDRDVCDLMLFKLITDRNIPMLGVCRGLQLMNVGLGGTLWQDLPSRHASSIAHDQQEAGTVPTHRVKVVSGTKAAEILGKEEIEVNSFHHQAIRKLAPGLRISGWATDSIPEMVEGYPFRPQIGVQFHPEIFTAAGDTLMLRFFRFLVNKADTFRLAKDIHTRILSVDTHTDTPLWFRGGYSVGLRRDNAVSIQKMREGKLDAQFLAAFLSQKERDDASLRQAVEKTYALIRSIYTDVEKYKNDCGIAVTEEDLVRLKQEGKKAFFIGIENGYGIGKDLNNIGRFKKMGVNYITLCHSYDNDICHSSTHTADASKGLTAFGREVVQEMNRVGMMIDLSHASEGTFWDVMALSKQPVIASHSGAKACCFHDRNLTDEQLRALARNGGVVQVCIFSSYLNKNRKAASVDDIVRHIDHIVRVAGIDHVGIGSDFDGGGGVLGCNGDNDMIFLTVKLLERGYTEDDLRKIWGGNFFRVMKQVQGQHLLSPDLH